MFNKICLVITLTFIITFFGIAQAIAQTSPSPTSKPKLTKNQQRLKEMQRYRNGLDEYRQIKDVRLAKALDAAQRQLDTGISNALACETETDQVRKSACLLDVKKIYNRSLRAFRLVKFDSILAGKPTECVKADLGVKPYFKAKGYNSNFNPATNTNPKETGKTGKLRVLTCGGNDNSAGAVKLKWRVNASNKLLPVTPEDKQTLNLTQDPNNLPNKAQVLAVEKELGL